MPTEIEILFDSLIKNVNKQILPKLSNRPTYAPLFVSDELYKEYVDTYCTDYISTHYGNYILTKCDLDISTCENILTD